MKTHPELTNVIGLGRIGAKERSGDGGSSRYLHNLERERHPRVSSSETYEAYRIL
jgi:hypothetical protein